jgi:hypothetical protein
MRRVGHHLNCMVEFTQERFLRREAPLAIPRTFMFDLIGSFLEKTDAVAHRSER